ncbi:hypothetical protein [Burkholderia ubonensis]|uniref:hypothetical protein n=1 Tax=Burkholderia ubonensis TaxID=101571 RepID=UPI000A5350CF|nr:hypothetical protein [Burkholderia ubonensis]
MYVYIESDRWQDEHGYVSITYTVGFYDPEGEWHPESDHADREEAAKRVAYLNGAKS